MSSVRDARTGRTRGLRTRALRCQRCCRCPRANHALTAAPWLRVRLGGGHRDLSPQVYGAYGKKLLPDFNPADLALLDGAAGTGPVLLALVHARGGGELGAAWHRAGVRGRKRSTAEDVAAAAAALLARGWAAPGRLALRGRSAGESGAAPRLRYCMRHARSRAQGAPRRFESECRWGLRLGQQLPCRTHLRRRWAGGRHGPAPAPCAAPVCGSRRRPRAAAAFPRRATGRAIPGYAGRHARPRAAAHGGGAARVGRPAAEPGGPLSLVTCCAPG
jgi:hypothetical protein